MIKVLLIRKRIDDVGVVIANDADPRRAYLLVHQVYRVKSLDMDIRLIVCIP